MSRKYLFDKFQCLSLSCFSNSSIRFLSWAVSLLQCADSTWQLFETTFASVSNSSALLKSLLMQLLLNKSTRFRLFRPAKALESINLMLLLSVQKKKIKCLRIIKIELLYLDKSLLASSSLRRHQLQSFQLNCHLGKSSSVDASSRSLTLKCFW